AGVLGHVIDDRHRKVGIDHEGVAPGHRGEQERAFVPVLEDVGVVHGRIHHGLAYEALVIEDADIAAAAYVPVVEFAEEADESRADAGGVDLVLDDLRQHRVLGKDAVDRHLAHGLVAAVAGRQIGCDVVGAAAHGVRDIADLGYVVAGGLRAAQRDRVEVHGADAQHANTAAEPPQHAWTLIRRAYPTKCRIHDGRSQAPACGLIVGDATGVPSSAAAEPRWHMCRAARSRPRAGPPLPIHAGRILPGLRMSSGSRAFLSVRITSRPAPSSASRYLILPWPTPCSPVQVPSMAMARRVRRCMKVSMAAISLGSLRLKAGEVWKWPSPTWPTMGAT